ncbi:MAG: hypothetical protein QXJ24_06845 [Thermoplasmatales archaeon]
MEDAVLRVFDGKVPDGLILRADISPNISQQFRKAMNILGIRLEFVQKHTPEDNGNIESFHASIKNYIWPYEFTDYRYMLFCSRECFQ